MESDGGKTLSLSPQTISFISSITGFTHTHFCRLLCPCKTTLGCKTLLKSFTPSQIPTSHFYWTLISPQYIFFSSFKHNLYNTVHVQYIQCMVAQTSHAVNPHTNTRTQTHTASKLRHGTLSTVMREDRTGNTDYTTPHERTTRQWSQFLCVYACEKFQIWASEGLNAGAHSSWRQKNADETETDRKRGTLTQWAPLLPYWSRVLDGRSSAVNPKGTG